MHLRLIATAAILGLSAACASSADDSVQPTPSTTHAASHAPESPNGSVKITTIDAPDLDAYLRGMRVRLPAAQLPPDDRMIRYGQSACQLTDGYLTGSRPTPSERLAPTIEGDGYDSETALDIADAARNAGLSVLCDHEIVMP